MKQLQRLFGSFVLVCVLALAVSADGIIHTGTPPPPPPRVNSVSEEPPVEEEIEADDVSVYEAATAAALDMLRHAITLF